MSSRCERSPFAKRPRFPEKCSARNRRLSVMFVTYRAERSPGDARTKRGDIRDVAISPQLDYPRGRPFEPQTHRGRTALRGPRQQQKKKTIPLCARPSPEGTARRRLRRTHADEPPKPSWIFLKIIETKSRARQAIQRISIAGPFDVVPSDLALHSSQSHIMGTPTKRC